VWCKGAACETAGAAASVRENVEVLVGTDPAVQPGMRRPRWTLVKAMLCSAVFIACGEATQERAADKVDRATDRVDGAARRGEEKVDEAGAEAKQRGERAVDDAEERLERAGERMESAGERAGERIEGAA
jgi:hypothetical protein